MARKTLETWIREALTDEDKDGTCSMLTLVHYAGAGQIEREIHTVKFGSKAWVPADLAKMLKGKADAYAQDMTGVQEFGLLAFYGGRNEAEARHPFRVNGEHEFGGLQTEGPTNQGLVAQSMRHNEALVQSFFRANAQLFETQTTMLSTLTNMLSSTYAERNAAYELVTKLTLTIAQGKHDGRMKELEFQRSSGERQELLRLVPALANTITGKEIFPQPTADSALIDALAERLDHNAIMAIAKALPQDLWGALASRLEPVLLKKKAQMQQDRETLKNVDPEADAAAE